MTSTRPESTSPPHRPSAVATIGSGAAIGVVVSLAAVTAALLASGTEVGSALGLGLFVAFWGGLGFGCMVGGVVWASATIAADEYDHRHRGPVPEPSP